MYSQNDETGIKHFFDETFLLPNHGGQTITKNFLWISQFGSSISVIFLKKKKNKKISKFLFLPPSVILKTSEMK